MPFSPHAHFKPPNNHNAVIWRYMDLAKLISMLERSALYFPRVDKLAASDPFEGYYTNLNAKLMQLKYGELTEELKKAWHVSDESGFEQIMTALRQMVAHSKTTREATFVSSWHALEHESAAMWALYLRSADGIAIRSNYQALLDALAGCTEFPIHIGEIRYIDYETDVIPLGQVMFPMMHKRKSFEHEHELRALIWTPEVEGKSNTKGAYAGLPGLYVPTDLGKLVDKIFVAPSAPKWFVEVVESLLKRYGLNKEVKHSELAASPLY